MDFRPHQRAWPDQGQVNRFAHYNPTKNEDALDRYTKQVYQYYGTLDGQLQKSGGKSVLPAGFSAVDAHYYPWVAEAESRWLSLSKEVV
jgi:glutathione S-transferase